MIKKPIKKKTAEQAARESWRDEASRHRKDPTSKVIMLRVTDIETYLRCPMQLQWRLEGYKDAPGVAMIEGTTHHEVLAHANEHRKKTGNFLSKKKHVDRFVDLWQVKSKEVEDWGTDGVDYDEVQERGVAIQKSFSESHVRSKKPKYIEHDVLLEQVIDEDGTILRLGGRLDICDEKGMGDYKTTTRKRRRTPDTVRYNIQLSLYSLALSPKKKLHPARQILLYKDSGQVAEVRTVKTQADLSWATSIAVAVAKGVKSGVFAPVDPEGMNSWVCQPKFCGYYHRCRGKSDKRKLWSFADAR